MIQRQPWTLEDLETRLDALVPAHCSIVTHNGKNDVYML